ncbi:hypothetical protein [Candidatus Vallotiella sp. (ex Adelges kitamiensis)]|uniref:hypothetical protein n=1 Tax=Candidatus Vallotiella sp. (ex Adelges kitamiensis) TaxID=2864217 RepID=UPI001CE2DAC8|nr:hypothetical protein [Candidatus Vallotia sp. (ex Adelges kitamiensis)]
MKKSLLAVSLLAVITLAACGKKDEGAGSTPATDASTALSPTAILQSPEEGATASSNTTSAAASASGANQ